MASPFCRELGLNTGYQPATVGGTVHSDRNRMIYAAVAGYRDITRTRIRPVPEASDSSALPTTVPGDGP